MFLKSTLLTLALFLFFPTAYAGQQFTGKAKFIESNKHDSYCVIDDQDLVHCWGPRLHNPPADLGKVKELSVSNADYACAIRLDDQPVCWGPANTHTGTVYIPPQVKTARSISPHREGGCAITFAGKAVCWHVYNWGQTVPKFQTKVFPMPSEFDGMQKIYSYWGGACVSDLQTATKCWQHADFHVPAPKVEEPIAKMSFDDSSTACFVTTEREVKCAGHGYDNVWPSNSEPVPEKLGLARDVSTGRGNACAVDERGYISCWSLWDERMRAPHVKVLQVAVGVQQGCAILQSTREVICWGENYLERL